MLARKYDEYAWELEEQQENTVRQTAYVKRPKQRNLKLMRRRIAVVAGILLATYFACVVRSECLISKSNLYCRKAAWHAGSAQQYLC